MSQSSRDIYFTINGLVAALTRGSLNSKSSDYDFEIHLNYECFSEQRESYNKCKTQLGHPTLLNAYLNGSKPIKLIYPDMHEKFVRLLTPSE